MGVTSYNPDKVRGPFARKRLHILALPVLLLCLIAVLRWYYSLYFLMNAFNAPHERTYEVAIAEWILSLSPAAPSASIWRHLAFLDLVTAFFVTIVLSLSSYLAMDLILRHTTIWSWSVLLPTAALGTLALLKALRAYADPMGPASYGTGTYFLVIGIFVLALGYLVVAMLNRVVADRRKSRRSVEGVQEH